MTFLLVGRGYVQVGEGEVTIRTTWLELVKSRMQIQVLKGLGKNCKELLIARDLFTLRTWSWIHRSALYWHL